MKKVIIIVFLILVVFMGINKLENKNSNIEKNEEEVKVNNNLAILLETEIGSGTYQESKTNTWPSGGYIFNDVLSYCENNTTLEWNSNTKSVILKNVNKSDKCYVYFDKVTFANYIISLYTSDGENNLYYHDGIGDYANATLEAGDNSYRYAGGDYHLTEKALKQGYNSIYDILPLKTNDGVILKNNYWWADSNRYFYLAYDEQNYHSSSLGILLNRAIKDEYVEYKGINNYICFGSSAVECPKENLYRIIGVFSIDDGWQVKLVKAGNANKDEIGQNGSFKSSSNHDVTYIGDDAYKKDAYYWDKDGADKQASWADSSLNTVNLNTNFVKYLTELEDGKWIVKIADTDWQVGGMTGGNGHTKGAKTAYDYELGTKKNPLTEENKKIGLMYVSDYYYAAPQNYWNLMGYDSSKQEVSIKNEVDYRGAVWDNWLWDGDSEWLITPSAGAALFMDRHGIAYPYSIAAITTAIRPCFYLKSNVEYASGDGSLNNPYRII